MLIICRSNLSSKAAEMTEYSHPAPARKRGSVRSIEELERKMRLVCASTAAEQKSQALDGAKGEDEQRGKFRTRMCKAYAATGACRYGDTCTFAHRESEKRKDSSAIYKFKTHICRS